MRGIFRFLILFFVEILIAGAAFGAAPNHAFGDEPYTVLLYGDPRVFLRYGLGREIRDLERSFGQPVIAYEINEMTDFVAVLLDLTKRRLPIQNLVVRGIHGGSYDRQPTLEVRSATSDDFETTSFADLQAKGVKLNLVSGARVFFDACAMIENENLASLKGAFNETKRLGFTTGSIYLNRTDGASGVLNTFTVPFYEAPGDWRAKMRVLAGQAAWIVVLPVFAYQDRYLYNQGYIYTTDGRRDLIVRTHAGAVEKGDVTGVTVFDGPSEPARDKR